MPQSTDMKRSITAEHTSVTANGSIAKHKVNCYWYESVTECKAAAMKSVQQ